MEILIMHVTPIHKYKKNLIKIKNELKQTNEQKYLAWVNYIKTNLEIKRLKEDWTLLRHFFWHWFYSLLLWTVVLHSLHSYVEVPTPNGMYWEVGALGVSGSLGETLVNEVVTYNKTEKRDDSSLLIWEHNEKIAFFKYWSRTSPYTELPSSWSWISQLPWWWEIHVCCISLPVYVKLL